MSTPYWGQLPGPKLAGGQQQAGSYSTRARRRSDDYDQPDEEEDDGTYYRDQPQAPTQQHQVQPSSRTNKHNRNSAQTTNTEAATESSGGSPFASPNRASFQASGLAPRPASMNYGANQQYPAELVEKRRRRGEARAREEAEASAAAPDVPRVPSYRMPFGNGTATATRGSARRTDPADADDMDPEEYYKDPASSYPVLDRSRKTFDGQRRVVSGGAGGDPRGKAVLVEQQHPPQQQQQLAPSASQRHQRKTSTGSDVERQRKFAEDRSPLQRLELTLDSITKEEKRARLEAAETRAKERAAAAREAREVATGTTAAGGQQQQQQQQPAPREAVAQQVRFRDVDETTPTTAAAARRAAADRPGSIHAHRGPLSQNPPEEGRRYGQPPSRADGKRGTASSASAGGSAGIPQRNLSFRERAAKTADLKLPNGGAADAGPLVQDSPVTTPPASGLTRTNSGGIQLTRAGSNKLKKEPPGDPWYSQRKEAERKYPVVQPRRATGGGGEEAARSVVVPVPQPPVPQPPVARPPRTRAPAAPPAVLPAAAAAATATAAAAPAIRTRVPSGAAPAAPAPAGPSSSREQQRDYDGVDDDDSDELEREAAVPQRTTMSRRKAEQVLGVGVGAAAATTAAAALAGRRASGPQPQQPVQAKPQRAPTKAAVELPASTPTAEPVATPAAVKGAMAGKYHRARVEGDPDTSDDDRSDRSVRHHHVSAALYGHHRDKLQPGQGTYQPPKYLDEWKKGTVGTLAGANLDLTDDVGQAGPSTSSGARAAGAVEVEVSNVDHEKPWWEGAPLSSKRRASLTLAGRPKKAEAFDGEYDETSTRFRPQLYLKCGPLLRFCGIKHEKTPSRSARSSGASSSHPQHHGQAGREIWRGSVMIVTTDADSDYELAPTLRLFLQPMDLLPTPPTALTASQVLQPEYVDPLAGHPKLGRRGETLYVKPVDLLAEAADLSRVETDDGLFEAVQSPAGADSAAAPGTYANRRRRIEVDGERASKYKEVRGFRLHAERGCTFWRFNIEVELRPTQQRVAYRINRGPSMNFWVPPQGRTMNVMFHSCNGFSMSVNSDDLSGPDPMWRDVLNTHQSQPFHVMVGGGDQIYNDAAMVQTRLFRDWLGVKNPLHKHGAPFTPEMQDELESFYLERYAMWFSQGLFSLAASQIPMVNMWDDHDIIDGFGSYPHHFMNTPVFSGLGNVAFKYYMLFQHQSLPDEGEANEPSWLLGAQKGPYINELSRSLFVSLGGKTALLAVDCRTERRREEVISETTWKKIMDRCYDDIVRGKVDHLLVLLGVPIAYPRLVWLENILTSKLMDPIKALGKTGLFGGFLNRFDGGVEVLDDLDDHWTAKNHKDERKIVIEDLQDLAADKSLRITILSGDVHLAAIGQFYSNPKAIEVPKHKDFRYMVNVVSSAIVNTPPPDLMADVLNKRNKVHQFDAETVEDMIPIFAHGVDGKPRNNKRLLPHRNWCSIRPYQPGNTPPSSPRLGSTSPVRPGGGIVRRLTKTRGPSFLPDTPNRVPTTPITSSRPPLSGGGLARIFSRARRGSTASVATTADSENNLPQQQQHQQPAAVKGPGRIRRTLSLTRGDSLRGPRNLFGLRRGAGGSTASVKRPERPDDGGINGQWGDDDDGDDDDERYYDADDGGARAAAHHHATNHHGGNGGVAPAPVAAASGGNNNNKATAPRAPAPPPAPSDYDPYSYDDDDEYDPGPAAPRPLGPSQRHPPAAAHASGSGSGGGGIATRLGLRGGGGSDDDVRYAGDEYAAGDDSYFTTAKPSASSSAAAPRRTATVRGVGGTAGAPAAVVVGSGPSSPTGPAPGPASRLPPPPPSALRNASAASGSGSLGLGGGGGAIKPLAHRTPTGLSTRQIRRAGGDAAAFDVDVDGGLEVTLNVEVSARDPAGITVPYKLVVPRLWYDDDLDEAVVWKKKRRGAAYGAAGAALGGVRRRWVSLRRGRSVGGGGGGNQADESGSQTLQVGAGGSTGPTNSQAHSLQNQQHHHHPPVAHPDDHFHRVEELDGREVGHARMVVGQV